MTDDLHDTLARASVEPVGALDVDEALQASLRRVQQLRRRRLIVPASLAVAVVLFGFVAT